MRTVVDVHTQQQQGTVELLRGQEEPETFDGCIPWRRWGSLVGGGSLRTGRQ